MATRSAGSRGTIACAANTRSVPPPDARVGRAKGRVASPRRSSRPRRWARCRNARRSRCECTIMRSQCLRYIAAPRWAGIEMPGSPDTTTGRGATRSICRITRRTNGPRPPMTTTSGRSFASQAAMSSQARRVTASGRMPVPANAACSCATLTVSGVFTSSRWGSTDGAESMSAADHFTKESASAIATTRRRPGRSPRMVMPGRGAALPWGRAHPRRCASPRRREPSR